MLLMTIPIVASKSGNAVQSATARVLAMLVREPVRSAATGVRHVRVPVSAVPVREMVVIISRTKPCNSPKGLL
jgi:hypothetical protein